jgi:ribosomal protein S6--L-glutamate ligase
VLARTRNRAGLAMLRSAVRPGVTVLTPPDPITTVRDKPRTAQVLAARGIATPTTWLVDSPALLRQVPADRFPLLLKPHAGDNARGIVLVRDVAELDDLEWNDSMVLAQEYVEAGAVDVKVYAAGAHVWAVRRPSPLVLPGRTVPSGMQRVEVTPALRRIATAVAEAFDLSLFGIDVLETSRGPLVVDVNEFPNFTGIDEAVPTVADLVADATRLVAA